MEPPSGEPPALSPPENTDNNNHNNNDPKEPDNKTYAHTLKISQSSTLTNSKTEQNNISVRRTTHNGIPAVIFKAKDYYGVMANNCKRTIVGKFIKTRPQIEKIRSKFSEIFPLKGSVRIGVYDNFNVFIDFNNEEDFNLVWFKRVVEINGLQMWLQKWSPDFKPEEDMPIVPVWVLLPGLPFHLYDWEHVKLIVSQIGIPLATDLATSRRSRPSMAKVRVEVDLLKPLPTSIWVGMEDDNTPLKGFAQKLEYEAVPKYCKHCKKLGHDTAECRIMARKKVVESKQAVEKEKVAHTLHNDKVIDKINEPHGEGTSKQDIQAATNDYSSQKEEEEVNVEAQDENDIEEGQWEMPNTKKNRKNKKKMQEGATQLTKFQANQMRQKKGNNTNEGALSPKAMEPIQQALQKRDTIRKKRKKNKKEKIPKLPKKSSIKFKSVIMEEVIRKNKRNNEIGGSKEKRTHKIVSGNNLTTGTREEKKGSGERGVSDTIVQEVDKSIKRHDKQTNHITKEKVDNRQISTSRTQECPPPDLQSETLSIPAERMSHTEALYQKRLKRMVDVWKKEWRKSLAEKERVQNTISEPL